PVRIAFIPAGVPTRSGFRRSGRLAHLDVHFSAAELGARLRGTGLGSGPDPATEIAALLRAPRLLAASPPLQAMAGRMAEEIRAASFSHDALDGILGEMIATLFGPGVDAPPACPGGLTLGQLSRIDRLMREELHRPLSVAEMAGAIGLSDSWFAHAWSQSRGEPPHRSLQRLRIERAKTLLLQGEQSLAAIALDAGFADQAHFTRSFRRLAGQTPGLWRRQRRPADDR
ncbi:helix-turn-helix transcriptional regulator, partial [Pseudogemmobacter sonorensis]|uniref:helix-turn-helix transcriptional regulator n=1 Tax=Pseudogemmobacter sonorensis TaxID=2989681 RepID=UPI0036BFBFB4